MCFIVLKILFFSGHEINILPGIDQKNQENFDFFNLGYVSNREHISIILLDEEVDISKRPTQ
jgi:hypothetical protein